VLGVTLTDAVHLGPDVRSRLASLVLGIRHFWRDGLLFPTLLGAEKTVTVSEDDSSFTLDNGIVTAQVAKRSGDLVSLKYRRLELLKAGSGHPFGYWSHDASRGERTTRITIDPNTNDGAFGEVSVKSGS
jgi:hypothetical protein